MDGLYGGGDDNTTRLAELDACIPKTDGDPERASGGTGERRDSFENVADGEADANATEEIVVGSSAAGIGGGGISRMSEEQKSDNMHRRNMTRV